MIDILLSFNNSELLDLCTNLEFPEVKKFSVLLDLYYIQIA